MKSRAPAESAELKRAMNGAYQFCEQLQEALDRGDISEQDWFDQSNRHFTGIYMKAGNPRAQSGHGGDEERYRYSQGMILEALNRSGAFLDVGCANGYLMEKLSQWTRNLEIRIDFHGLDFSQELLELAAERIPDSANKLFLGNALYWQPHRKFDYFCVRELSYVPRDKLREFFFHLYDDILAVHGRLILGPAVEISDESGVISCIQGWGISPSGYCIKSHQEYRELSRRLYWFEKE